MRRSPVRHACAAAGFAAVTLILFWSSRTGLLIQFLLLLLMVGACLELATLGYRWWRGRLRWLPFGSSDGPPQKTWLGQAMLRWMVWITVGVCLQSALRPVQFSAAEFVGLVAQIWLLVSLLLLCTLASSSDGPVLRASNVFYVVLIVYLFRHLIPIYVPSTSGRTVVLTPPVNGRWVVLQGGDSALINHHFYAPPQRYALDLIKPEDGRLQDKHGLEDFATFGQSVYAPIQGRIVALRDELADGLPGSWDARNPWGNHVVIEAASDIYVMLAHLQQDSLVVQLGAEVQAGQYIGRCGNSGRSTQPHLHLHAMDHENPEAKGNRGLPMRFLDQDTLEAQPLQANQVLLGKTGSAARSAD
jgi:hypothetical protein